MSSLTILRAFFVLVFAVATVGCGEETTPQKTTVLAPGEEVCAHLTKGPFEAIEPTTTPTDAPTIEVDHIAYTAEITESSHFLNLKIAEKAEYSLNWNLAVDLHVHLGQNEIEKEESGDTDACAELTQVDIFDLEVGSYEIEIAGQSDVTYPLEIKLVVEEAVHHEDTAGHDEHEDDHEH